MKIFEGLFDSSSSTVIGIGDFLACVGCALILGLIIAATYTLRTRYTSSFLITLSILPAVVCVVIMMVNGNVGAGVAVAGAFSLVRFRSAPGTAKEISTLFLAMGSGLIAGMGYIGYAALFTGIMCAALLLFTLISTALGGAESCKTLNITVPEDLDYREIFDDALKSYTKSYELVRVKTANMGSVLKLSYTVKLKSEGSEKELIDDIRLKNGNLEVSISRRESAQGEL